MIHSSKRKGALSTKGNVRALRFFILHFEEAEDEYQHET